MNLIRNNNNEIVRSDGGSGKLPYGSSIWDKVCLAYFSKSDIYPKKMYGDVLWVGMGDAYGPRNQSENVTSTTILEKDWNIIEGCAYSYDFKDQKFDFIILDIWAHLIYASELKSLMEKYTKHLKKEGIILHIKTLKIIN